MPVTRRQLLAALLAAPAMRVAAATTGSVEMPPASGNEPLLDRFVSGPAVNAHVHLLPASWWAPENAARDEYGAVLDAAVRRAQFIVDRVLDEAPAEEVERYRERAAGRSRAWTLEDAAAIYVEEMEATGFDKAFHLTMDNLPIGGVPGTRYTDDFLRILENDARMRERFPGRFISFAGVDPRRGADATKLLETAVRDLGFAGYGEMIGTLWDVSPADRELMYPLYEKAGELGVPVILDATQSKGRSRPKLFEQVASDFPELSVCLAGAGAGVGPVATAAGERPAREVMLNLAERFPNVYLELGDWQAVGSGEPPFRRDDGSERITLDYLRRALDGPARKRIVFGSDYPVFAPLYTEQDWVARLLDTAAGLEMGFSPEDWNLFFSENAIRFTKASPPAS